MSHRPGVQAGHRAGRDRDDERRVPRTGVVADAESQREAVRGTLSGCARRAVSWPGVKTPTPVVAVAGPDQYDTSAFGIVSAGVPPPVV
jgi:hypothetical protein